MLQKLSKLCCKVIITKFFLTIFVDIYKINEKINKGSKKRTITESTVVLNPQAQSHQSGDSCCGMGDDSSASSDSISGQVQSATNAVAGLFDGLAKSLWG